MLQTWREQFEENLEECRPDLLKSMKEKGTLEQYLDSKEDQAIEMAKLLKKDGLAEDQVHELVIDSLFLREKEEPEEDDDPEPESTEILVMTYSRTLSFLTEKAEEFLKRGEMSPQDLLSIADEEGELHIERNPSPLTLADAILYAAEKSSLGIGGLRMWLGQMSEDEQEDLILEAIMEGLNS